MKVVGGSASIGLAQALAKELGAGYIEVGFERHPGGFPDGERYVRLLGPVGGDHVVLVQAQQQLRCAVAEKVDEAVVETAIARPRVE